MKLEKQYLDSIYRLADIYNESSDETDEKKKSSEHKLKKEKSSVENVSANSPIRLTSSITASAFEDKMLENQ